MRSRHRTPDPEAARLHVVAALPLSSLLLASHNATAHFHRMDAVAEALERDPWFVNSTKPFAFIVPGESIPRALGDTLAQLLLERGNVLLCVQDFGFGDVRGSQLYSDLIGAGVLVPYLASASCSDDRRAGTLQSSGRSGYAFHGNTHRADGGVRGALRNIRAMMRTNVSWRSAGGVSLASSGTAIGRTLDAMRAARLCFVPSGDTSNSRRLFDALAVGCIPVVMRARFDMRALLTRQLPFPRSIDWNSLLFALAPGLVTIAERREGPVGQAAGCRADEARWLDQVHEMDAAHLLAVARRGHLAFCAHLDVRGNARGVADALLCELTGRVLAAADGAMQKTTLFAARQRASSSAARPIPCPLRADLWQRLPPRRCNALHGNERACNASRVCETSHGMARPCRPCRYTAATGRCYGHGWTCNE